MPNRLVLVVFACAVALAGCSTPDSRIERNRAAFAGYSPAVQARIRAGEIELGYTPEMVALALGRADRVHRRHNTEGETEIWAYVDKSPTFGFGIGIGGGGRHSGGGVAVGTATGGDRGDRLRVIFDGGRVKAIERFER
ncbi:MAG: hypothetical protein IPL39_05975 [Opitutaceae bacterium]|nr:hypothetical protein [Opitutaceae bacterium]